MGTNAASTPCHTEANSPSTRLSESAVPIGFADGDMRRKKNSKDNTVQKLEIVRNAIRKEYCRKHTQPWIVAYSGGKDSTLLLSIVWEVVQGLPEAQRCRKIYIVGNDTLVESPLIIKHLKESMKIIQEAAKKFSMPFETIITTPCVDQTFWVNVIGRGYIPPTRNFRWCTDRMKILPTNYLIEKIVRRCKKSILLIGTRKSESQNRRRNMEKYKVSPTKLNLHKTIPNCRIFAPLADMDDEDVWMILMQRKAPWGSSHRNLITLYRNAGGGDCPLVLSKDDAPSCGTTSPRFGCWTCTVVQKDRSMRGLIASGCEEEEKLEALSDFRDWLISLREDKKSRMSVRRNGYVQNRANGNRVMGPFKLEVRQEILRRLKSLEKVVDEQLISRSEIEIISDIWARDDIRECGRKALARNLEQIENAA